MDCPECGHENTEGAWLCINCGDKLPRPETAEVEESQKTAEAEEPSQFAPKISENLRKLRDQTERERSASERSASDRGSHGTAPKPGAGRFLGLSVGVWAAVAVVLIAFAIAVSILQ